MMHHIRGYILSVSGNILNRSCSLGDLISFRNLRPPFSKGEMSLSSGRTVSDLGLTCRGRGREGG